MVAIRASEIIPSEDTQSEESVYSSCAAQERLAPEPEECIFAEIALLDEIETRLNTDDEST